MNRTQWKDFFREIRKNKGRYFSLLFIVALGCAFYSGIRSSEPDMTTSVDRYYDESNFCDIRILSTLGLTDEDVDAIAQIPGVKDCEGTYNVELFAVCDHDEPVINVISVGESLNYFSVQEGRLPENDTECFADAAYMARQNCKIGDTITLMDTDRAASDKLTTDTFTIVGYGTYAWYLNLTRGSASIGNGSVDAFLALHPSAFTQDYYSTVFATVEGAADENCYKEAYDDIVAAVKDRIDGIATLQVQTRHDSLVDEGEQKLADAQQQVDDAKQELLDAQNKLTDGEDSYREGRFDYQEAEQKLADGKKEYLDGMAAYEQAAEDLANGQAAYDSGLSQYYSGLAQYNSGASQLASGRAQLQSSRSELDAGWSSYNEGKAQYDAGMETLAEKEQELTEGEAALDTAQEELDQKKADAEAAKTELEANKAQIEEALPQIDDGIKQAQDGLVQIDFGLQLINAGLSEAENGFPQIDGEIGRISAELDALYASEEYDEMAASSLQFQLDSLRFVREQLELSQGYLVSQKTELETQQAAAQSALTELQSTKAELEGNLVLIEEGLGQIEEGMAAIEEGQAQIDANREELEAGKEAIASAKLEADASLEELEAARTKLEAGESAYSSGEQALVSNESQLASAKAVLDNSSYTLYTAQQELSDGQSQLDDAKRKLDDAKEEIANGESELSDGAQTLADAKTELEDGWNEYLDGKQEADDKIAEAETEIADGRKALEDLDEGKWYVLGRDTIQTAVEYGMDAERIGKIGNVFPVIFFLVAALVSLTTMTRMIEEERMLIGTMKALGYGKFAIISKYLIYAGSATLTGGILGVLIGSKILPYVIMTAYGMLYTNVPYTLTPYHFSYCAISIGFALLCTVGAAFAACYRALLQTPAGLMRPPAPKIGRKILLERMPLIWNRLNFSLKSTIRNLLRYKKRLFMTVFGIGGCMAILLVSYGLHDSIAAIVNNQYKRIWTYSASCGIDDTRSNEEKYEIMEEIVSSEDNVENAMLVRNLSLDVSSGQSSKNAYLYVVEDTGKLAEFLSLHNRTTQESYTLNDSGVIITEKLGRQLSLSVGDQIMLKISDTDYKAATVKGLAENYMYNYIYMTPALYRSLYGEEPSFNEIMLRFDQSLPEEEEDHLAEDLLSRDGVISVSRVSKLQKTVDNMMNALNLVVWVLVISAGLLVLVVTYNLNSINISERRRELASLKVLGFYDLEVAMYVYRENIFLTIFGIAAGLFMGTWLHRVVITTLEVEMIMFGREISIASYIYSSIVTCIFSILVNLLMYYRLKQIDMVESLKSVVGNCETSSQS